MGLCLFMLNPSLIFDSTSLRMYAEYLLPKFNHSEFASEILPLKYYYSNFSKQILPFHLTLRLELGLFARGVSICVHVNFASI